MASQTGETLPTLLCVKQASRLEVNKLISRVVITAEQHNSQLSDRSAPRGEIRETLMANAWPDTVVLLAVHSCVDQL